MQLYCKQQLFELSRIIPQQYNQSCYIFKYMAYGEYNPSPNQSSMRGSISEMVNDEIVIIISGHFNTKIQSQMAVFVEYI